MVDAAGTLGTLGTSGTSGTKEINKEDVVEKIQEYRAQIEALERQAMLLDSSISEHASVRETLIRYKDVKKEDELLIPIGANTYIHARAKKNDSSIIGIGANIFIEKSIDDIVEIIQKKIGDFQIALSQVNTRKEYFIGELSRIYREIQD